MHTLALQTLEPHVGISNIAFADMIGVALSKYIYSLVAKRCRVSFGSYITLLCAGQKAKGN